MREAQRAGPWVATEESGSRVPSVLNRCSATTEQLRLILKWHSPQERPSGRPIRLPAPPTNKTAGTPNNGGADHLEEADTPIIGGWGAGWGANRGAGVHYV